MSWPLLAAYVGGSIAIGLVLYFGLCGSIYYAKYVRDRAAAASWKCQPDRWLSPQMNRHAIILGASNMTLGSLISGTLAYFIFERGKTALYFDLRTHGILFTVASIAVVRSCTSEAFT